jgi:4-hydroxy-2-oxoheptanedioate aldolase
MAIGSFSLRERLKSPEPFLFTWVSMTGTVLVSQLARLPFDGVTLDLQHGMTGFSEAVGMVAAINAAGKPAIIRTLWNDPGLVGQALDIGAAAVIAPMVNSVAEARALVHAAKYPPVGGRSWGGYGGVQAAGVTPPEYLAQANGLTMVFAMIETQAALDKVEEIAAVPGLDGLFVGPSDLSIALSRGAAIGKTAPHTIEAMKRISAAAKANKLVAGAFAGGPDVVKTYHGLGFNFMAAVVDVDLLKSGAEAFRQQL